MSTGPASAADTALLLETPRRLSVAEYHRMIEAGILGEDERVELLEGVIVSMSPQGGPHAYCIQWLTKFLVRTLGEEYFVRVQLPITPDERNEPEPDLAVVLVRGASRRDHPTTALLVIEVAGESKRRDERIKAPLYARAGVGEYWIVDVDAEAVKVFTEPDAAAAAYRRVRTLGKSETLVSPAFPAIALPVADLFA